MCIRQVKGESSTVELLGVTDALFELFEGIVAFKRS